VIADSDAEPRLSDDDELTLPPGFDATEALQRIATRLGDAGPIRPQASFAEITKRLPAEVPVAAGEARALAEELADFAGAYSRRNAEPGFMGFICSPGLATDPVAHAAKALLNQNVSGFTSAPGATAIEQRVIRWFTQLCGFASSSGGAFVAGGSMGNFTGLACGVYQKSGYEALEQGLQGQPLVIYCSTEAHFSVERAVRILGLGSRALRRIPTDDAFRMDANLLEAAIQVDLAQGKIPCAVVATIGTTATGSIDPLVAIETIARRYKLWLHVDAAYGGSALLSSSIRDRLGDFSTADSIAIDLHKWLYLALDAGMILFRDRAHAEKVFGFQSDYVAATPSSAAEPTFLCHGLEASRPFRALAPYWALRQFGSRKLGRNIQFNADCAAYLAARVRATPQLLLVNSPELSICCFRYQDPRLTVGQVDSINERIRVELEREGRSYLSPTRVGGRPVLRVCLVSSATRPHHLRELLQRVVELGSRYAAQP
jgi:glutamate/tyrosine decarboxylase-like PLP-dependent enzyme